ncbi:MAG: hypothetical protein U5K32_09145 [Bacteroidales bacterium]|nr:hypothetical protein [Bacteroidales bacterium]
MKSHGAHFLLLLISGLYISVSERKNEIDRLMSNIQGGNLTTLPALL